LKIEQGAIMEDREFNLELQPRHAGRRIWREVAAAIRGHLIPVAIIAVTAAAILATGAPRGVAAGPEAAPSSPHVYLPSISDLMIATIEPRHERLWRAAQDQNWELAAYELGNLRGAFERLGLAHPTTHDISFPEMITSVTGQPFEGLKSAIQSKDVTSFAKAYADLTDACNSCHQALNHSAVDIRIPSLTSASDLNTKRAPGK
jgi:hypothetical protein